jgi:hypothetical protein
MSWRFSAKDKARRTWEEIFPTGDVAALAEVVHPDCVDHGDPPGSPQGFEGAKRTMLWLGGVFSTSAGTSTRSSAMATWSPSTPP